MTGMQIINICGVVGVGVFVFIVLIIGLTVRYTAEKKLKQYRKELTNPQYEKVAQYKEAYKRFKLTQRDYWKSLRGTKFERALANLYIKMGFSVQQTKATGDEGIDLILSKDNKTIIVQCKGHNKPVGVGVVRDLYGTMMHFGATSAVLACPAGFTEGVIRFVMNKPIQLISAIELIKMAERK